MLKEDPNRPGWVEGWAVVCLDPWDFQGVPADKSDAALVAKLCGAGYQVKWGSRRPGRGSKDFESSQGEG